MKIKPSLEEQLAEAQRELKMRRRVYPGWIADGRISNSLAQERLERQQAIVDTLTQLIEKQSQPSLFDNY